MNDDDYAEHHRYGTDSHDTNNDVAHLSIWQTVKSAYSLDAFVETHSQKT
jgi:hypothetical protein